MTTVHGVMISRIALLFIQRQIVTGFAGQKPEKILQIIRDTCYGTSMERMLKSIGVVIFMLGIGAASLKAGPVFATTETVASSFAPTVPSSFVAGTANDFLTDGSSIFFTPASSINQNAAFPGDNITIGTVGFSPSTGATPLSFDVLFDFHITLTDTASATSGTFDYTGELTGSETASPTQITSTYKNLTLSKSSLVLGGNAYSIALAGSAVPSANNAGVLQVLISVPEPATLSFACLAGCLVFIRRR